MLKIAKQITTSLITFTLLSSFAEAAVPAQPGPYVGAATNSECTAVRLNFADNSTDESNFTITLNNLTTSSSTTTTIGSNGTSTVYTTLSIPNVSDVYSATVVANNSDGSSTSSDQRVFRMSSTFGCPIIPDENNNTTTTTLPATPGNYIGVTDINKTAVQINFKDNSTNETTWKIEGDITDSWASTTTPTTGSQVYHELSGLTCDQPYTIQAVASNANGDSAPTDSRVFNIHTTFSVNCN